MDDEDGEGTWARPPLPSFNPQQQSLVFQQIEIDHYIGKKGKKNMHKEIQLFKTSWIFEDEP